MATLQAVSDLKNVEEYLEDSDSGETVAENFDTEKNSDMTKIAMLKLSTDIIPQ